MLLLVVPFLLNVILAQKVPAQYYADTGVVTIVVGNRKQAFNFGLTTILDKMMVFGDLCVDYPCLQSRSIVNGFDGSKEDYKGTFDLAPGLSYWNLNAVPFNAGSLSFKGYLSVILSTGADLNSSLLEVNSFNNFDGFLPMRFGADHFLEQSFSAVPDEPKMVTFAPAIGNSLDSGMYVGNVPEGLCEPFSEIVPMGKCDNSAANDYGLISPSRVRYGQKTDTWNVFLRFGPYISFNQKTAEMFFGQLANKEIMAIDFRTLSPNLVVTLPGVGEVVIPTKAMFKQAGDFYSPLYQVSATAIGDFGLNQAIIKERCIRVDKSGGAWSWGLANRIKVKRL